MQCTCLPWQAGPFPSGVLDRPNLLRESRRRRVSGDTPCADAQARRRPTSRHAPLGYAESTSCFQMARLPHTNLRMRSLLALYALFVFAMPPAQAQAGALYRCSAVEYTNMLSASEAQARQCAKIGNAEWVAAASDSAGNKYEYHDRRTVYRGNGSVKTGCRSFGRRCQRTTLEGREPPTSGPSVFRPSNALARGSPPVRHTSSIRATTRSSETPAFEANSSRCRKRSPKR